MRKLLSAALVAVVFAAVASADHSWGNYHWARKSNPFALKTGDNVSSKWRAYLDEAIFDWNQSAVLQLQKVTGGTNPKSCRPTSGRIEVCSSRYGYNGWLGLAQIWISGSHITQAISKVNDSYFDTQTYDKPEWRRLVMCQEIAHDFGLDHQDEIFNNPNLGSCMDYTNNPLGPPSNEHPNAHDYDQIQTIYSHTDNTTTVSSQRAAGRMPPAMNQIALETPAQWGRLVRSNADGRVQVYVADFGRGHRVITHVFWADPEADARGY